VGGIQVAEVEETNFSNQPVSYCRICRGCSGNVTENLFLQLQLALILFEELPQFLPRGDHGSGALLLLISQMPIKKNSTALRLVCIRRFNESCWVYRAYRPLCAHC
jgi:hypothetical protein